MSTLTLVRHGQAQPFQRESAELTSLGEAQAATLAQFWLRNRARFDEVYCGVLARQVRTEQVIATSFRTSDQLWPAAQADAAWNEYDVPGVLRHPAPADPRLFQRMFEAAMLAWLEGDPTTNGAEPWAAFSGRVSGAIGRLMEGPPGRRVAVFTSGGPIGFAAHFALHAPARSFLDLNWRIRNCSVTEFVFDRERFTLDSFNGIAHLSDAALRTYR